MSRRTCFERCFVPLNLQYTDRCCCSLNLQTSTLIVVLIEFLYCAGIIAFGISYKNMSVIILHAIIVSATLILLAGRLFGIEMFYIVFIVIMDFVTWFIFLFCGIWYILFAAYNGHFTANGIDNFKWISLPLNGGEKTMLILMGTLFIIMWIVQSYLTALTYCDYRYLKRHQQPPIIIVNPT